MHDFVSALGVMLMNTKNAAVQRKTKKTQKKTKQERETDISLF